MAKDKPTLTDGAAEWLAGYHIAVDDLSGPQAELANAIHAAASEDAGPTAPDHEPPGGATITRAQWDLAQQQFAEWSAGMRTDREVARAHAEVLLGGDDDDLCDRLGLSADDLAAMRKSASTT